MATSPAAAAGDDTRSRKQKKVEERARAAATIDVLRADEGQVQRALDALDANAQNRAAAVAAAQESERRSLAEEAAARVRADRAATVLREAKGLLIDEALRQYTEGNPRSTSLRLGNDINHVARAVAYGGVVTSNGSDTLDLARQARGALEDANRAATAAARRASVRRSTAEAEMEALQSAQADQQRVADALEQKIAATTNDLEGLTAEDAELAAQLAAEDTAARAAAAQDAAAQAQRARQAPTSQPGPTGRGTAPVAPVRVTPRAPASAASTPSAAVPVLRGNGLSTVRGITVATSIAASLSAMLAASDVAGLRLSGGGYRSSAGQVATRRANCGPSQYDIYSKPASACSPPTAQPGRSMHERGLAIDFTNNGSLITSRSNPAFRWLAGNAARYGFFNLPSEPWHWSTNGN